MAILKVKKLNIIAMQTDQAEIVQLLQHMNVLDIDSEDHYKKAGDAVKTDQLMEIESKLSSISAALEYLSKYVKRGGMFVVKPEVTNRQLQEAVEDKALENALTRLKSIQDEIASILSTRTQVQSILSQLFPWEQLEISTNELGIKGSVTYSIGTIPGASFNSLTEAIKEEAVEIKIISRSEQLINVLAVYHNAHAEAVNKILRQFGWMDVTLPISGFVAESIKKAEAEIKEYQVKEQALIKEVNGYCELVPILERLYDYYSIQRDALAVQSGLERTQNTFMISGWVRKSDEEKVRTELDKTRLVYYMESREPVEGERYPTVIENKKYIRPFETVTSLFSTPDPGNIDPNAVMAPFFLLFFGMMVADAAYGVIMSMAAIFIYLKFRPQKTIKNLLFIIGIGGITTAIWGVVFGSWFGSEIVPSILFVPMNQPIQMLVLCLGLGLLQIFTGIGVKAYMNIRDGNYLDALFDQGFWYIFLIGLVLLVALPSTLANIMAIAGAVGLILTQGRHKKNPIKKLTSGLLSLYAVSGYFSDVLSYARIFALGLATGVIGMVVNTIGVMMLKKPITFIFGIAFLAIGHTFNIAINVLGAYVHTSRLQYIEFFGKFFEGGGRIFKPFGQKTKYTRIIDKLN